MVLHLNWGANTTDCNHNTRINIQYHHFLRGSNSPNHHLTDRRQLGNLDEEKKAERDRERVAYRDEGSKTARTTRITAGEKNGIVTGSGIRIIGEQIGKKASAGTRRGLKAQHAFFSLI